MRRVALFHHPIAVLRVEPGVLDRQGFNLAVWGPLPACPVPTHAPRIAAVRHTVGVSDGLSDREHSRSWCGYKGFEGLGDRISAGLHVPAVEL